MMITIKVVNLISSRETKTKEQDTSLPKEGIKEEGLAFRIRWDKWEIGVRAKVDSNIK